MDALKNTPGWPRKLTYMAPNNPCMLLDGPLGWDPNKPQMAPNLSLGCTQVQIKVEFNRSTSFLDTWVKENEVTIVRQVPFLRRFRVVI